MVKSNDILELSSSTFRLLTLIVGGIFCFLFSMLIVVSVFLWGRFSYTGFIFLLIGIFIVTFEIKIILDDEKLYEAISFFFRTRSKKQWYYTQFSHIELYIEARNTAAQMGGGATLSARDEYFIDLVNKTGFSNPDLDPDISTYAPGGARNEKNLWLAIDYAKKISKKTGLPIECGESFKQEMEKYNVQL